MLRFTTEGEQDPKTKNKVIIISGFTRPKVWFGPLTPPSSTFGGQSSKFKTNFSTRVFTPHHCFGTWKRCMEPPKGPANIQG
jgi:hypothetical protein